MRPVHVPPGSTPPKDWLDKAAVLTEQLRNAPDNKARVALIFAQRRLWRDKHLLDWLTNLHHRKCWYSEARESVSSYHVDHFRPKGRAAQLDGSERPGYWWLVFDWTNYRLCGQLLNVKKRDVFPVTYENVANEGKPDSLNIEGHLLLDPLSEDAWLVSFERNDDGECLAGPCPGLQGHDLMRVEATIDILGLNRLAALTRNRADVWDKCLARIQEYERAGSEPVMHTCNALRAVAAKALVELCSEEAEFSSVAKACIEKMAPLPLRHYVNDLLQHSALRERAA
ncbi:hypothetical protein EZJ58_5291 [Sodalis ligni]|uniref:HNH endonuclease n=1 Tax=Sodalis ligni TaxID=2697027 RepID=A0A4R1NRD4_9GAMM|nr:hypothetical protein EZJ58_5291 [Sodalis ligni]